MIRWADEVIQKRVVRYAGNPAVTVDERLAAARWIAEPATLRASCRELLGEAEKLPEQAVYDGSRHRTRREALALLATRWVLADQYAQLTVRKSHEESYELEKHPEVVGKLSRCIAEDRSVENTLETLREALKQSGTVKESANRQTAEELMRRLSRSSTSQ